MFKCLQEATLLGLGLNLYIVNSDQILTRTLTKSSKDQAKIQVPHLSIAVNPVSYRERQMGGSGGSKAEHHGL